MTEVNLLASLIKESYGTVKRARGPFLYTAKGVRLTDLYQEGGKAILGWGGSSAFTLFKNVLNRGVTGSFITDFNAGIERAVSELLASNRKVIPFSCVQSALEAACKNGLKPSFWRAFNPDNLDWKNEKAVIVQPPLSWSSDICFIAVMEDCDFTADPYTVSAPLMTAYTRAVYNVIKAQQEYSEKDWFIYDKVLTKYWTRKGPYLYPKVSEKDYPAFVRHCLSCAIVISPLYNTPSIVPFGADRGVFSRLEKEPF